MPPGEVLDGGETAFSAFDESAGITSASSSYGDLQSCDLSGDAMCPGRTSLMPSCPRQSRRYLRKLGKSWSLDEVKCHNQSVDGWIVVRGRVYDITEHVVNHPGWHNAGISTVLSIVAHLGSECTEEFEQIHRMFPVAWRQLEAFYIGDLQTSEG